jgi:hypothetical protein
MILTRCDNFTLYRITLKNSPNFHASCSGGNGFTVRGVKVWSPGKGARNTDGIDPGNSTNVTNRDLPPNNMFVTDASQPADLISMNGYVIAGKVHVHMTLATPKHAFGGHLKPRTEVFTLAIVTIGVMKDGINFPIWMTRTTDKSVPAS